MKKMKIFSKTFIYTLVLMLCIIIIAHLLLYLFIPHEFIDVSIKPVDGINLTTGYNVTPYVKTTIIKALPYSFGCCVFISIIFSFFFSRKITIPIKKIGKSINEMTQMKSNASCSIDSEDEIGELSKNINNLYQNLLSSIKELEIEKKRVSESEKSKVEFLRVASHELKTPVTALNATLENMMLGVGKYKNYDTYLPECKEMTERLIKMIHDILDTSKVDITLSNEEKIKINLSKELSNLCEPYILIAKTRGIIFKLELPNEFFIEIQCHKFEKAVSNIIANAVAYTDKGNHINIFIDKDKLIIENECTPIPAEELQHLFEPFYRLDFARSRDNGGNGLGLYIVSTLFKSMDISYSFKPMKKGMRFTVNLINK